VKPKAFTKATGIMSEVTLTIINEEFSWATMG
jgi:hypothetical protein